MTGLQFRIKIGKPRLPIFKKSTEYLSFTYFSILSSIILYSLLFDSQPLLKLDMIDSTEEILSLQRIQNRLQSTSNHELPSLLSKLLPNLLPLANKEGLRNATVSVISDCIRRIKSSKCIIDLVPIITACINPALLPFACNFSFTLIDIVLPFILEQSTVVSIKESTEMNLTAALYDSNKALTQAIVCAIGLFEEFTIQSNSLCFYILQLLDYLPSAMDQLTRKLDSSVDLKKIKDVIGNCAIDVCLLYRSLSVDGNAIIGSIQPGLSSLHIDRLNIRMKSMPLPFLNDLKLKLLSFVPFTYIFHPHHAVLLSIICKLSYTLYLQVTKIDLDILYAFFN